MRWVGTLSLLAACASGTDTTSMVTEPLPQQSFRAVIMSDPHVIDDDYKCCEGNELDTTSIYETRTRLAATAAITAAISPRPEIGFVTGDVFHQAYRSNDVSWYLDPTNASAPFLAKEALDAFAFPVHAAWGNHDYELDVMSREGTHQIFKELFGVDPYYKVDHNGVRFLMANSQAGPTWDANDKAFDTFFGSFGVDQLNWLAEQLDEGLPSVLMFHHPPYVMQRNESPDARVADMFELVEAYEDQLIAVFVGHSHRWIELPGFDVPTHVVAATRYDADNFWVASFDAATRSMEILDYDKAEWGTVYGETWSYDGTPIPAEDPQPSTATP